MDVCSKFPLIDKYYVQYLLYRAIVTFKKVAVLLSSNPVVLSNFILEYPLPYQARRAIFFSFPYSTISLLSPL